MTTIVQNFHFLPITYQIGICTAKFLLKSLQTIAAFADYSVSNLE